MERYCKMCHAVNIFLILHLTLIGRMNVEASAAAVAEEVEHCDLDEMDNAKRSEKWDPSFCQEVITYDTPALYNQDDYNILAALATSVLNKTYPNRLNTLHAFAIYDEMPHPVPTGASSYFMVLFTVIFTWYFNKFIHRLFMSHLEHINLFPVTDQFPNIKLYMLQQSRRESRLNRHMRNTWAWLATHYLLQPSDPLVNPDEVFKTWADFRLPQNVWAIIKAVLRVNALDNSQVYFHDNLIPTDRNAEKVGERQAVNEITMTEQAEQNEEAISSRAASWGTFKGGKSFIHGSHSLQEMNTESKHSEEEELSELSPIPLRRSMSRQRLDQVESARHSHYSEESLHGVLGFWK